MILPTIYLFLKNDFPVDKRSIKININGEGVFQSVSSNGKTYTLEEWNKLFTEKDPGPIAKPGED